MGQKLTPQPQVHSPLDLSICRGQIKKKEKPLVVYDEQKLKFGQRKIPGY